MSARSRIRPIEHGDGHPLPPFRWWQSFSRSIFHLRLTDAFGAPETWSIDVRHGGDENGEPWVDLYRERRHHARSRPPAVFPVPGGEIEVATSGYGVRRAHYVAFDGTEVQLTPDPVTAEGRRARLERSRPGVSRALGAASVLVLVVALVLGVPQIVADISRIPPVAEYIGTFTSPWHLPAWMNVTLIVATIAASTERALRLRYNRLLDGGLFDGDE